MNFKSLVIFFTLIMSFSASASIGKEDLVATIKGRYVLQTSESGDIHFLLRSSGKLEVVESDWYSSSESIASYPAKISIEQGDNGLLRGLPVAHLIFSEGSDEQVVDYHILLTAEQNWDRRDPVVRLLTTFVLENDGPNQVASVISKEKMKLLKYDSRSKKFIIIK